MTTPSPQHIRVLAPGKVVLWGEYAVLAGAPALVMAVDRYAVCELTVPAAAAPITTAATLGWRFSSAGFVSADLDISRQALTAPGPPPATSAARIAWEVLKAHDTGALPESASINIDTSGFYQDQAKLGLGSSAAVCVALYGALCELLHIQPSFDGAAATHHRLQGGSGSGIDVAAAYFGGLQRFQRRPDQPAAAAAAIEPVTLPRALCVGFVWAGYSSSTPEHLQRFARWRERGDLAPLEALTRASAALFEPGELTSRLQHYTRCLGALDQAANLSVYGPAHVELDQLAAGGGVVYKPCGAGGGDIGAAFSYDQRALDTFMDSARARGYTRIKLETAAHGIQVSRR